MRKYIFLLLAAVAVLASGCSNYKNIDIRNVEMAGAKMVSVSQAEVNLQIETFNPTRRKFCLADAQGTVFHKGQPFARLTVPEEVCMEKGGDNVAKARICIELVDPLQLLSLGLDFKQWDLSQFTFSCSGIIRSGAMKKKIRLDDLPVGKLAKRLNR